jgi:hypothetical protein
MMALLSLMRRRLCHYCHCHCCPHNNGIIAIFNAQASLPSLSWCCCPRNNGVAAYDRQQQCCSRCNGCCPPQAGIVTLIAMALSSLSMLLPSSIVVKLASLLSIQRGLCNCPNGNCCSCHDGVIPIVNVQACLRRCWIVLLPLLLVVELASLPSLLWHCCH